MLKNTNTKKQQKQQNKKKALTLVTTKKSKPNSLFLSKTPAMGAAERRYIQALVDPFTRGADGVTIPDEYGIPTVTRKFLANHVLSSPIGGTVTSVGFSLIASPLVTYADLSVLTATTVQNSGLRAFTANPGVYGATSYLTLRNAFTASRVVACGFRVRMEAPQMVRTGRIIFVPVPYTDNVPSVYALESIAMTTASSAAASLFANQGTSSIGTNLLELPGSFEMSMDELGSKDLLLRCKPTSPKFLDFITAANTSYNATYGQSGEGVVNISTGAADSGTVFNAATDLPMGHNGWLVYAYGLPSSATAITPWFSIETVFHLEGTPICSSSNSAELTQTSVHDNVSSASSGNFSAVLNAIRKVDVASVIRVAENVSNVFSASSARVTGERRMLMNG